MICFCFSVSLKIIIRKTEHCFKSGGDVMKCEVEARVGEHAEYDEYDEIENVLFERLGHIDAGQKQVLKIDPFELLFYMYKW